jgi:hypothetical protein
MEFGFEVTWRIWQVLGLVRWHIGAPIILLLPSGFGGRADRACTSGKDLFFKYHTSTIHERWSRVGEGLYLGEFVSAFVLKKTDARRFACGISIANRDIEGLKRDLVNLAVIP